MVWEYYIYVSNSTWEILNGNMNLKLIRMHMIYCSKSSTWMTSWQLCSLTDCSYLWLFTIQLNNSKNSFLLLHYYISSVHHPYVDIILDNHRNGTFPSSQSSTGHTPSTEGENIKSEEKGRWIENRARERTGEGEEAQELNPGHYKREGWEDEEQERGLKKNDSGKAERRSNPGGQISTVSCRGNYQL